MSATDAQGSDGRGLDLDSLPAVYAYNGSNQMTSATVTSIDGKTYKQTYTWTGNNLTATTKWELQ